MTTSLHWPPVHEDDDADDPGPAQAAAGRPAAQAHFDALYAAADDPWQVRERWYERRKRALLLAALPRARFAQAFEPACGNGELTAALALRCDRLLASDASPRAVALARRRVASQPHVQVECASLPDDWPAGAGSLLRFDLVVFSELGYYMRPADWRATLACCSAALAPDAVIAACHFRPACGERVQATADVHAAIDSLPGLVALLSLRDADFQLDVWGRDGRSVAQREGVR